jgi:hypothetical protein
MDFEAESASEFDVFGVGFEDDWAESLRAKEAADIVAIAAEASEDDRRRMFDGICFSVWSGIRIGRRFEPVATCEKGERGEGHGESNDGIEASGLIEGEDTESGGLTEEDEGKLTALEHGKGVKWGGTRGELEEFAKGGENSAFDEYEAS